MNRQPFLTPRKHEVLEYIHRFREGEGFSPTLREMAIGFEISHVTLHEHVHDLVRAGLLSRLPHKARSLQLTRKALGMIREKS